MKYITTEGVYTMRIERVKALLIKRGYSYKIGEEEGKRVILIYRKYQEEKGYEIYKSWNELYIKLRTPRESLYI